MISLPGAAIGKLAAAEEHEGYLGAFMKGIIGTILATPCSAPFLGPALGVAFATTNDRLLSIFTAVGLGMASPFMILSAFPKLLRFLPRPGAWMEHFKQLMGFFMMATVAWLMLTLGEQIGVQGLAWNSGFLIALALSCWILGRQTPLTPVGRRLLAWTVAITLAFGGWWIAFEGKSNVDEMVRVVQDAKVCPCADDVPAIEKSQWAENIPWQPWSKGRPETLARRGYTVYVDYTATWCPNCLAHKKATLEMDRVRTLMRDMCVIPIKADFTSYDADIYSDLQSFGRSAIPLNVIFPAGGKEPPIVMPENLIGRTELVVEKLQEAGPSMNCARTAMRP
jgi:thiol:disulfide interchange protein DsbD